MRGATDMVFCISKSLRGIKDTFRTFKQMGQVYVMRREKDKVEIHFQSPEISVKVKFKRNKIYILVFGE